MRDEPRDEELAELRALWSALRPGELPGDLADADEETRRSVAWMRAAWAELEPPPAPAVPRRPRLALARPARASLLLPVHAWGLVAAAALLAVLVPWIRRAPEPPGPAKDRAEHVASGGAPAPAPEPGPSGPEPIVSAIGPNHVEFRSGNVRLVLVTPDAAGG